MNFIMIFQGLKKLKRSFFAHDDVVVHTNGMLRHCRATHNQWMRGAIMQSFIFNKIYK